MRETLAPTAKTMLTGEKHKLPMPAAKAMLSEAKQYQRGHEHSAQRHDGGVPSCEHHHNRPYRADASTSQLLRKPFVHRRVLRDVPRRSPSQRLNKGHATRWRSASRRTSPQNRHSPTDRAVVHHEVGPLRSGCRGPTVGQNYETLAAAAGAPWAATAFATRARKVGVRRCPS